jgi:hypothetical protein
MDSAADADKDNPQEHQPLSAEQMNRQGRTFAEVSEKRRAGLEGLMRTDSSGCTDKEKAIQQQAIDALPLRVKIDNAHVEKQPLKRMKSASTETVRAPPMNEHETRRQIMQEK